MAESVVSLCVYGGIKGHDVFFFMFLVQHFLKIKAGAQKKKKKTLNH